MTITTLNFTGRRSIPKGTLSIVAIPNPNGTPTAVKARIVGSLKAMKFPEDALVVIEAYRQTSLVRFDCGTIGDMHIPNPLSLEGIDPGGTITFRIKVVRNDGSGVILGMRADVRLKGPGEAPGRAPLIDIQYEPLGNLLWDVSGDIEEAPLLRLNSQYPEMESRFQSDVMLKWAILPAALSTILRRLVTGEQSDDPDDWRNRWLRFCRIALQMDKPPLHDTYIELDDWIGEAVRRFSDQHKFLDHAQTMLREAAE